MKNTRQSEMWIVSEEKPLEDIIWLLRFIMVFLYSMMAITKQDFSADI